MFSAKVILSAAISALCATVVAQTPGGFSPNQQEPLGISFGGSSITAGSSVAQSTASNAPSLRSIALGQSTTGLVMMIDIDANNRLHWLAPGVTPDLSSANGASLNVPTPSSSNGATYAAPNPPAGSSAHRYVILLFTQPNNYALPSTYSDLSNNRANFNYQQFITDLRLGSPLAAGYFTVSNGGSGSASSSISSASSSRSSASSASSLASSLSSRVSSAIASASSTAASGASSATSAAATATGNAAVALEGSALLGLLGVGVAAML